LSNSKCYFGVEKVELGHFISKDGVATNPTKIMVVQNWPMVRTIKQLRGFLGLARYYGLFVKSYGSIVRPLTNMLKKNNFCCALEAKAAFEELKNHLPRALVLALPNFSKEFVVEVDASSTSIGDIIYLISTLLSRLIIGALKNSHSKVDHNFPTEIASQINVV